MHRSVRGGVFCCVFLFGFCPSATVLQAQARYRLDVDNSWSEATHPGAFPPGAHFSWFGGATHDDTVSFWSEGELASPGITQMAEDGSTFILMDEVARRIREGSAGSALSWRWWFCPSGTRSSSCGRTTVEFEIDAAWPRVTLVSMLGPTPDWFVGVSGLPLRENGQWLSQVVVDLRPYDNGTRSANQWALFGPRTMPPETIRLITVESGELVGPGSLGTLTFTLLSEGVFLRGDCTGEGSVNLADAVCALNRLFGSLGAPDCLAALDANGDAQVNIADPVYLLTFLFADGPRPADPFPDCGPLTSPADTALGCETPPGC